MHLRLVAFGLFAVVLCACSSDSSDTNNPPVIDSVDAPASVTAADGAFTVPITILAHDDDKDAIKAIHYKIPAGEIDQTEQLKETSSDAAGVKLTLMVADSAPRQTYEYSVSVIDARGAESAAVTKTVTFE